MTAVDRTYLLAVLSDALRVQDGRAQLPAEKTTTKRKLTAETRSYTLSLAIDAVNEGLLEQLHAEAQQVLFTDAAEPVDDGPDLVGAMDRHSSAHGTAAVYDPADPHDAALAQQARAEHVDYAEAAAVREIEREMAIEAGDDSEIDRQVAEDDARFERAVWLAQQEAQAFERHQANIARDTEDGPHRGRPHCEGCPDCIGYTDPNEPDDENSFTAEQGGATP